MARYNGKRKGIKLGLGGVEVIDTFKQALVASDLPAPAPKRPRSTVRIYQEDKSLLEVLFNRLEVAHQGTQADRLHALLLWASGHLEAFQSAPVAPALPDVAPPTQAEHLQHQEQEEVPLQAEATTLAEQSPLAPASPLDSSSPLCSPLCNFSSNPNSLHPLQPPSCLKLRRVPPLPLQEPPLPSIPIALIKL